MTFSSEILALVAIFSTFSQQFTFDQSASISLLTLGKQQLDIINEKSKMPLYGTCWSNAIAELKVGCRFLTDELQSDLALKLTNCFLLTSGQSGVACLAHRRACLKQLTDREFNAYAEFYTHAQNICFFLQSKYWHEESERTIDRLSTTSFKVSMQLADAGRLQEALLKQQKKSLDFQENMAVSMETSKEKINAMMNEIRITALEQQLALSSLFTQLSTLQTWAVGELSWLDSIFFYSSAAILSCLFTSMARTRKARLPILIVYTINYGCERYLCYALNSESASVFDTSANLQSWVWFIRKIATVSSFLIWLFIAYTYCDYNAENHQMLVKILEFLKNRYGHDELDSGEKILNRLISPKPSHYTLVDRDHAWVETNIEKVPDSLESCAIKSEIDSNQSVVPDEGPTADETPRYSLRRSQRLKRYPSPC